MKLIFTLLSLGSLGYGLWWFAGEHPEVKHKIESYIKISEVDALEIRHTPEQIMEDHRRTLLRKSGATYLSPILKFYPYLLLEVKFTPSNNKTKEGIILWDLTDGEMVIDSEDWEKTHGFCDCIQMSVQDQEFKILQYLSKKGKVSDEAKMAEELKTECNVLDIWLKNCIRKGLVVASQDGYRLHLEKPNLAQIPETKLKRAPVTKPFKASYKVSQQFSSAKIERMAKVAFGKGFSIRRSSLIYLPVYNITVQNPNGSVHTSFWNASNGIRLPSALF
ncbi:MAG TPA: hypothetical protein VLG76_00525 [Rhabdochlamydiaceae bacterium]|nr:hypothetical protein [Rhabdochlamydiaceae bacterium]